MACMKNEHPTKTMASFNYRILCRRTMLLCSSWLLFVVMIPAVSQRVQVPKCRVFRVSLLGIVTVVLG